MQATAASQEAFRNAVLSRGTFPHPSSAIDCIETHMSWVFLAGNFAYKVKKPVRFAFADFSTLERRQFFCEEELRINRRFSPDLYLGLVPIGGSTEAPVFGASPAFEYAVQMRRFDAAARMDRQLEDGKLDVGDLQALAASIDRYQEQLADVAVRLEFTTPAFSERQALANINECASLAIGTRDWHDYADWVAGQVSEHAALLSRRRREGKVRAGHGDLHLENIVRIKGHLQPFDALEFDPALRHIDTLDEVAFTAMDLMARGHAGFAYEFLSAYLERCGDYAGVPLLRFFLFCRALVRAKVAALTATQHGAPVNSAGDRYLGLAENLLARPQPVQIVAHGLSGSGKTTVLGGLIGRLQALRIRSDVERKRLHALAVTQRSASEPGAGLYSAQATEQTYALLAAHAETLLRSGTSVMVDAAFLDRERRERFYTLAARCGAPTIIVDCVADVELLRERITHRARAGADASEADVAVLEWQRSRCDQLSGRERALAVEVNAAVPPDMDRLAAEIRRRVQQATS